MKEGIMDLFEVLFINRLKDILSKQSWLILDVVDTEVDAKEE